MNTTHIIFVAGAFALLAGGLASIAIGSSSRKDIGTVLANQKSVIAEFDKTFGYKEPN